MARRELSRERLLPALGAFVLEHGLAAASLRPLARGAGTSDRMLVYHFGSKEQLIAAVLDDLTGRFAQMLDQAFGTDRARSRTDCAKRVLDATSGPAFAPFLRLWWEIVAGAARGDAACLRAGGTVMDAMQDWVIRHLPEDDPDPASASRIVLTQIEGVQMLQAVRRKQLAMIAPDG